MKKVLLAMLAATFAITAFTACDDDDDKKKDPASKPVAATGVKGDVEGIKKVYAVYSTTKIVLPETTVSRANLKPGSGTEATTEVAGEIESADFNVADKKFSLTLPGTINTAKYNSLKVADAKPLVLSKDIKYVIADFEAHSETAKIGLIEKLYLNEEQTVREVEILVYVDRDATLKGEFETKDGDVLKSKDIWDAKLVEGWNAIYYTMERIAANEETETPAYVKNSYTTSKAGQTLAWEYLPDAE